MSNRGRLSVAGDDEGIVIEHHQLLLNGGDDLRMRAAPQVGAADALSEQGISREENIPIACQVKARTARRMAWCVNHTDFHAIAGNGAAVFDEVFDGAALR